MKMYLKCKSQPRLQHHYS